MSRFFYNLGLIFGATWEATSFLYCYIYRWYFVSANVSACLYIIFCIILSLFAIIFSVNSISFLYISPAIAFFLSSFVSDISMALSNKLAFLFIALLNFVFGGSDGAGCVLLGVLKNGCGMSFTKICSSSSSMKVTSRAWIILMVEPQHIL